jgi:hypothetical protein
MSYKTLQNGGMRLLLLLRIGEDCFVVRTLLWSVEIDNSFIKLSLLYEKSHSVCEHAVLLHLTEPRSVEICN